MIAMDIDGTLLDSRFKVPAVNLEAIAAAAARGIEIVIVTGRRFDFAYPIAMELPCDPAMIVNNGAVIKSKSGETHLRHLLPRDLARRVLEETVQFREGTAVVFDRVRENQMFLEKINWDDPGRQRIFRAQPGVYRGDESAGKLPG